MTEDVRKALDREYATLRVCLLVKKLGFRGACITYRNTSTEKLVWLSEIDAPPAEREELYVAAPMWQQVMDYLRAEQNVIIEPSYDFIDSNTFNIALIQTGENGFYHSTDIVSEPDFYKAREHGIIQAIQLINDGVMEVLQFENWFSQSMELYYLSGLRKLDVPLNKEHSREYFNRKFTPEAYINELKKLL